MKTMPIACLALCLAAPAVGQQTHVTPAPAPAIGYDWNDDSSADDRIPQTLWPRADASAAGIEDMIHTEQAPVHAETREGGDLGTRAVRSLRKFGGDYIVIPVLKLHLGHPRQETP